MSKTQPIAIPLRTPATWTNDNKVNQCYNCRTAFGMWNRKHHCRVCGRIFCHSCSNQKILIPSFIRHFIASSLDSIGEDEKRVCSVCYNSTHIANTTKKEIYIFANLPLDIKEINKLAIVNKKWKGAIDTLASIWHSIQYKLPHTKFTKLEKALLVQRINLIQGHNAWAIQITKALNIIPPSGKKHRLCEELSCRKGCIEKLSVYDLLELYTHNHKLNMDIDRWCSKAWLGIHSDDNIHLMPWWVHIFRTRPHIATRIFINEIVDDMAIVYAFLFELKLQSQDSMFQSTLLAILNHCLKIIPNEFRKKWQDSNDFITVLERLSNTDMPTRRERIITEYILNEKEVVCPWNVDIIIHRLGLETSRLNTVSKPLKMTLYTNKGNIDILYKMEDVRKDRMTMDISYWLQRCTDNKVEFTTYSVFPVTSNSGIIQMLDGVTTLYDVKHKHHTTLQNFILDRNSSLTVDNLRTRFVKSVAAACVLSYVIGVGDRHLENMLVTDDGKLIHVDFGYLLGDDPKHVQTEMRITPDMLDALGGKGSATFTSFQELCGDVYKILRTQSSFWYCLLTYLSDASPRIGTFWGQRKRIQQHVLERLCPGEMEDEATMQIVEIVKRSSKDGWGNTVSDTVHRMANTIKEMGVFNMDI